MDITDINKVASRKRMNTDAEKLREKVSRETAKIIKLKVAQDTAYWDLKEKLQQVEGAHERLQQNMVDVQMQHEAVSAHYQHELRLRPDTLNKVQGTRDICEVVEEYGARLQRSVTRCRADRAALAAAYAQCGARVRRLAADLQLGRRRAAQQRAAARLAAQRLADALQRLGGAQARLEELAAQRQQLAGRLERAADQLERKDKAAAEMREDLSRLMREFDAQTAEMRKTIAHREQEAQALRDALEAAQAEQREQRAEQQRALEAAQAEIREQRAEQQRALEAALAEQREQRAEQQRALEAAQDEQREQRKSLQRALEAAQTEYCEQRAELQRALDDRGRELCTCANKLAEAENEIDLLKKLEASHIDETTKMQEIISDKSQLEKELEAVISSLKTNMCKLEEDKMQVMEQLSDARQANNERARVADELQRQRDALNEALQAEQRAAALQREADAAKIGELSEAAAAKDRALHANTGSIARLMAELKSETEARARADAALGAARAAQQAHDAAQLAALRDMRADKLRLQERIQAMQSTIDNIQHELTGRAPPAPPAELPELDAPKAAEPLLYSFLSDGSVDGDALDPREVGRRFKALARGDATLRRRPVVAQDSISLSQVKDDLKIKNRTFFKNKRYDSKVKRLK